MSHFFKDNSYNSYYFEKGRNFLENVIQNGGYNGMMYLAILFLESTPHKTYI